MTDSPTPTPDAISAAFREAREVDPKLDDGFRYTNAYLEPRRIARMAALDKCEQAWKERERPFPMLNGPPIPWALAEVLYIGYSAMFGTTQSLELLASRGGWGWDEIPIYWKHPRGKFMSAILAALKGAPK